MALLLEVVVSVMAQVGSQSWLPTGVNPLDRWKRPGELQNRPF